MEDGYIKWIGKKERIYQITAERCSIADAFREQNNLESDRKSIEILEEFSEMRAK